MARAVPAAGLPAGRRRAQVRDPPRRSRELGGEKVSRVRRDGSPFTPGPVRTTNAGVLRAGETPDRSGRLEETADGKSPDGNPCITPSKGCQERVASPAGPTRPAPPWLVGRELRFDAKSEGIRIAPATRKLADQASDSVNPAGWGTGGGPLNRTVRLPHRASAPARPATPFRTGRRRACLRSDAGGPASAGSLPAQGR